MQLWIWKWAQAPGLASFRSVLDDLAAGRPQPALGPFEVERCLKSLGRVCASHHRRRPPHRVAHTPEGHPVLRLGPLTRQLAQNLAAPLLAAGLAACDARSGTPLDDQMSKNFHLVIERGETLYDPPLEKTVSVIVLLYDNPPEDWADVSDWCTLSHRDYSYLQTAAFESRYILEWGRCAPPDWDVTLHKAGRREPAGAVLRADSRGMFATFENECLRLPEVIAAFEAFYARAPWPENLVWRDISSNVPEA